MDDPGAGGAGTGSGSLGGALREWVAGLDGPQRGECPAHLFGPLSGRQGRNPGHLRCSGRR